MTSKREGNTHFSATIIGSKSIQITIDRFDIHKFAVFALDAVFKIITAYRLHTDGVGLVGVLYEIIL